MLRRRVAAAGDGIDVEHESFEISLKPHKRRTVLWLVIEVRTVASRKASEKYRCIYVAFVLQGRILKTINVTKASSNLCNVLDDTAVFHEPPIIMGKRSNAVLLADDYCSSINETLHLLSVTSMRESISRGTTESIDG